MPSEKLFADRASRRSYDGPMPLPPLPQNTRDALHTALLVGTPVLALGGLVVFGIAETFPGYISAVMLLALAGCSYAGARELKEKPPSADLPPPAAPEQSGTPLRD
jgi:hypothetical protein